MPKVRFEGSSVEVDWKPLKRTSDRQVMKWLAEAVDVLVECEGKARVVIYGADDRVRHDVTYPRPRREL